MTSHTDHPASNSHDLSQPRSEPHSHADGEIEDHDRGLGFDLQTLRHRRGFLGLLGVGAAGVGGTLLWGSSGESAAAATTLTEIPTETAGPYPGDGSNGPDVLTESGIVRSDIRRSFGSSTTRAKGQPFEFAFKVKDTATGEPVQGLAVYAWHANRDGEYSMYGNGITDENYLRGVQVSDHRGRVAFRSIYPACYSGRWPHVHFEVYANVRAATGVGTPLVTSQMALPRRTCMQVYRNVTGYSASVTNLERVSLASDMVFGDDGGVRELATITGSIADGYLAKLVVPVTV